MQTQHATQPHSKPCTGRYAACFAGGAGQRASGGNVQGTRFGRTGPAGSGAVPPVSRSWRACAGAPPSVDAAAATRSIWHREVCSMQHGAWTTLQRRHAQCAAIIATCGYSGTQRASHTATCKVQPCTMPHAACNDRLRQARDVQHAALNVTDAITICNVQRPRTTCTSIQLATCNIRHATCTMQHAASYDMRCAR